MATRTNNSLKHETPLSVWEVLGEEYWNSETQGMQSNDTNGKQKDEYDSLREAHGDAWRYLQTFACRKPPHDAEERVEFERKKNEAQKNCDERTAAFKSCLFELLHKKRRSALCFSGGGIRSATFGLGVLQGLAKHSWKQGHFNDQKTAEEPALLSEFDYLSTVSGGGYVGSWFSAWARREQNNGAPSGVETVIKKLVAAPDTGPVTHLRRYSNYLTAKKGLLSGDTWTWVATIMRNIFLNWLVLLPLVAAILLVPPLFVDLESLRHVPESTGWFLGVIAILSGAWAYAYLISELPSRHAVNNDRGRFLLGCLAPISLCLFCLSLVGFWWMENAWQPHVIGPDWFPTARLVAVYFVLALLLTALLASLAIALFRARSGAGKEAGGMSVTPGYTGVAAGLSAPLSSVLSQP